MTNTAVDPFDDVGFTAGECQQFARDGYLLVRQLIEPTAVEQLLSLAQQHTEQRLGPLEYEADVRYPGAPKSRQHTGGDTPRRLLHAWQRDERLRAYGSDPRVVRRLAQLFGSDRIFLSQAHHNCIMTKCPSYSSDTGWHQDVRYWAFSDRELINAWLALRPEQSRNGGLKVIPGSHRWRGLAEDQRLDDELFLRPDHPSNIAPIAQATQVDLSPGDVLFFHAALFHAATRNFTEQVKYSAVFTYHGPPTRPLPGTKSTSQPEIELEPAR